MKCVIALCSLFFILAEGFQNGDVRLAEDVTRGRVEVFLDGEWGSVCYDTTRDQRGVAQAICRQIGQHNQVAVNKVSEMPGLGSGNDSVILAKVFCSYSNNPDNGLQHILRCQYSTDMEDLDCPDGYEMGVECTNDVISSMPYDTMVRLYNPNVPYEATSSGFLEVYVNEQWGPTCNVDQNAADTACRQLSYTNAVDIATMTNYTRDEMEVLDTFDCGTSQNCLRGCFKYPSTNTEISCEDYFSYVTCTFDVDMKSSHGSQSACNGRGVSGGVIAGAVIGAVVGFVALVVVLGMVAFCVIPLCKKRSTTKYDAI